MPPELRTELQDDLLLRERLKKEFEQICEDQEELRTRILVNDVDAVHLPCNFNWLIKLAQRQHRIQVNLC